MTIVDKIIYPRRCADCDCVIGNRYYDYCELEDGRRVCHPCAAEDSRRFAEKLDRIAAQIRKLP